jgi:hypothetical protein
MAQSKGCKYTIPTKIVTTENRYYKGVGRHTATVIRKHTFPRNMAKNKNVPVSEEESNVSFACV